MNQITITTTIQAPIHKVWAAFTQPEHITEWNFADTSWECSEAINNFTVGEKFVFTMAAKDGSSSFDFSGTYTQIIPHETISYTLDDNREVTTNFEDMEGQVVVTQTFQPEDSNPIEMQKSGWQSILDNFKDYLENTMDDEDLEEELEEME